MFPIAPINQHLLNHVYRPSTPSLASETNITQGIQIDPLPSRRSTWRRRTAISRTPSDPCAAARHHGRSPCHRPAATSPTGLTGLPYSSRASNHSSRHAPHLLPLLMHRSTPRRPTRALPSARRTTGLAHLMSDLVRLVRLILALADVLALRYGHVVPLR